MYKDQIVQCPRCGLDLLISLKDQYQGDIISSANFRGMGLYSIRPLDKCICPKCKTAYALNGSMYVKNFGWSKGLKKEK